MPSLSDDVLESRDPLLDPNEPAHVRLVQEALAAKMAGKPSKGVGHTLALLLISLFLFWTLESASTGQTEAWLAALVLVLAVHEAGHFIAMRAFGFTDLKVFFIPFLGAAASGRKTDATPAQRALVSLMGPLPGIVLAFVASFTAPFDSRFVADLVVLALAINAFNLLPVLPLDGGHYFHWTLFARWPSARRFIRLLNALALVGLGWALSSQILLWFGLFMLLGAVAFVFDGTATELRRHLEPGEDLSLTVPDRVVPFAMEIANRRRFARTTKPVELTTYASAIALMWGQVYRVAPISKRQTIALLAAYLGTMALVPAAAVMLALAAS